MMKNKILLFTSKKNYFYIFCGIFILHLIADFSHKFLSIYNFESPNVKRIIKGLFLLLSFSTYFIRSKRNTPFFLNVYIITFLFFSFKLLLYNTSLTFFRYFFLIGILPLFYYFYSDGFDDRQFIKILKYFLLINFFAVIIGFVFNLDIFLTYGNLRFGFNGLLLNQMQTPYFYICALFIFYNNKDYLLVLLISFCMLFSGVKASIFGLFLFIFFTIITIKIKNNIKLYLIFLTFLIFLFVLYYLFNTQIFKTIIVNEGIITAITSYRNINFENVLSQITKNNFNILIGTTGLQNFRTEFGVIDVILYFGFVGLVFYFLLIKDLFLKFADSQYSKIFIVVILLTMAMSGNFFYFPFNCLMFLITLLILKSKPLNC